MLAYIGTKLINAKPMTRLAYNKFRGWDLPADENGEDEGFLVEYMDGGAPNVDGFEGYVSWSPAEQFGIAYRSADGMPFGLALEALKRGFRVARDGWNGKDMWLVLDPGTENITPRTGSIYDKAGVPAGASINPHIDMMTAQGDMQPGWSASQADMMADDWVILRA